MADERERERGGEGSLAWWRGRKEGRERKGEQERESGNKAEEGVQKEGGEFSSIN